ncbi:MAG: hypothetical protein GTN36_01050 [Candidatus Aenigmarchaeota archaeon]|nr:hypothetical protein [Candidatus Aenigmarchaeota archaeon]
MKKTKKDNKEERKNMKGFRVKKAKSKKAGTNEIFTCFEGIENYGVRVFHRGANEKAGEEYHTGDNPSKNPERFYIANGRIEFNVSNGKEDERREVEKGMVVEIDPYVWHATRTLSETIYLKVIEPGQKVNDTVFLTLGEYKERFGKKS